LFIDRTRQDHLCDLGGCLVRYPQAIDKGAFDAKLGQHLANLRAASMHNNRIDSNRTQQHDILCKVARRLGVTHRMTAIFDHKGSAGIALKVWQRFNQNLGLSQAGFFAGAGHCAPSFGWFLSAA